MILYLRSDKPKVSVKLKNGNKVLEKSWEAGRELSLQLLGVIDDLMKQQGANRNDITGIVVYRGPGSYTGLRITVSVANSLGYALEIPVVGVSGENWLENGDKNLEGTKSFKPVSVIYGGEVYTTKPKK